MKRLGNLSVAILGFSFLLCAGQVFGQVAPRWKTQTAFQRALTTRFEMVEWPQASQLRDQLERLAQWQQVAVFLDRRIDPSQSIRLSARDISLAELLDRVAAEAGGATAYIGSVVYIGPRETTDSLLSASKQRREEARAMPGTTGSPFLRQRTLRWDELAEPRQLLAELGKEVNADVVGLENIPHDLWPAVHLPSLSWADRMSIVLAGFGLTYEFDRRGRSLKFVPLPKPELVKRQYTTTLSQVDLDRVVAQFPNAVIQKTPAGVSMQGTAEEHERLRALLARQATPNRPRSGNARTVHSLRVQQQQIGAILKTLERQLNLTVQYDAEVREKLYTRVTFDLRDVSLEELLKATLEPASLTFRRSGDVIQIEEK